MRELFRQNLLALDEGLHQFEDHMGVELLFLAAMSERFSQDAPAEADVEKQIGFIDEHPLRWMGELHGKAERAAERPYYPALIELAWGVLLWDRDLLGESMKIRHFYTHMQVMGITKTPSGRW